MKKIVYTVTFDNEVLEVFDNPISMKDYIWAEFEAEFIELENSLNENIDRNDCLDYCDEFGVRWQKFEIEI